IDIGRSSIKLMIEVWSRHYDVEGQRKVTEGDFVYVAIDDSGRTRQLPKD
ncbi:MAG: acyl-CoA thioesterase, partial [Alteromonadaceae bacterium]